MVVLTDRFYSPKLSPTAGTEDAGGTITGGTGAGRTGTVVVKDDVATEDDDAEDTEAEEERVLKEELEEELEEDDNRDDALLSPSDDNSASDESGEEECLPFRLSEDADLTIVPCSRIFSMIFFFLFVDTDEREDSECRDEAERFSPLPFSTDTADDECFSFPRNACIQRTIFPSETPAFFSSSKVFS